MNDKVTINGLIYGTMEPLMSPVDSDNFLQKLLDGLGPEKKRLCKDTAVISRSFSFRKPPLVPNPDNPIEAKWALLLPPRDRTTEDIADALSPLVNLRHGQVIYSETPLSAFPPYHWIKNYYQQMDKDIRPYYVLLAGSPQDIPFKVQYHLGLNAAVGRLSFDNKEVEKYSAYAKKVVDFETRDESWVEQGSVVFATEKAEPDATYFSRHHMTDILVKLMHGKNIPVKYLVGNENGREATLANLLTAFTGPTKAPALVFTASHGLAVKRNDETNEVDDIQRKLQGALCCQDYDGYRGILSADLVPKTRFLHGSVFFSFACYSAGTPIESDFFHWYRDTQLLACRPKADFVAALPQRLLSHPKGPLAFLGHIDPSWVYSFADPQRVNNLIGWKPRMGPFLNAVDSILQGHTVGLSTKEFSSICGTVNADLLERYEDEYRRDPNRRQNPKWTAELMDTWMTRNDLQNFIILGDPAVKAKMSD